MRGLLLLAGGLAAIAIFSIAASPVLAQVVYDNGSFVGATGAASITDMAVADDFVGGSGLTFNAIRFYAVDAGPGLLGNFSGTLNWEVRMATVLNSLVIPDTNILASGTTSLVSVTDTGETMDGNANLEIAQLDFSFPAVTLGGGLYWLRIDEGLPASASDGSAIAWVLTGGTQTHTPHRWDTNEVAPVECFAPNSFRDLSYQLLNNAAISDAPEPGTFALTLGVLPLGIAGFVTRRRKH